MTFENFWDQNRRLLYSESTYSTVELAWNAATAAERQRCREIATAFVGKYLGSMTVKEIADEIGE